MNTFDKIIREKLEQTSIDSGESTWTKVLNKMPVPWYVPFFKVYLGWISAGLIGSAWLFSSLNSQVSSGKVKSSKQLRPETIFQTIVDTVYIAREIVKPEIKYVYINESLNSNPVSAELSKKGEKPIVLISGKNAVATSNKSSILTESDSINKTKTVTKDAEFISKNLTIADNHRKSNLEKKEEVLNSENEENKVKDSEKIEDSSVPSDKANKDQEILVPVPSADLKPKKDFAKTINRMNPKLGMSMLNTFIGSSYGFNFDLALAKSLSFTTGISYSQHFDKQFQKLQDFNQKTGKEFKDHYKPNLGPRPQDLNIKNIEIKNEEWLIPLQLNYLVPINYKLSFMLSSGVNMRIGGSETLIFDSSRPLEDFIKKNVDVEKNYKFFNSFTYSMGLRYNYKRIYVEALPTFILPFEKSLFLKDRNRVGFQTNIRWALLK
jgi:hypothetical protein